MRASITAFGEERQEGQVHALTLMNAAFARARSLTILVMSTSMGVSCAVACKDLRLVGGDLTNWLASWWCPRCQRRRRGRRRWGRRRRWAAGAGAFARFFAQPRQHISVCGCDHPPRCRSRRGRCCFPTPAFAPAVTYGALFGRTGGLAAGGDGAGSASAGAVVTAGAGLGRARRRCRQRHRSGPTAADGTVASSSALIMTQDPSH